MTKIPFLKKPVLKFTTINLLIDLHLHISSMKKTSMTVSNKRRAPSVYTLKLKLKGIAIDYDTMKKNPTISQAVFTLLSGDIVHLLLLMCSLIFCGESEP